MGGGFVHRVIVIAGFVLMAAALSPARFAASAQQAASYPDRPIRVVIAQQAGSSIDTNIRVVGTALGEALGQPLVIDNRPGAGGALGMTIGAAAPPDGYTLVGVGSPQMVAPYAFKKLGYDLFGDFVPVARYIVSQNALVTLPNFPAANVRAFIDLLKSKPGQFNMASAGPGSASQLAGVLFNTMAGIDAVHIPYKGGGAAVIAVLANEAQYYVTPLPGAHGQIRAGRLKALGVGGETRAPQLPQVPTIEEAGLPGYRSVGWTGLLMPRGAPPAMVTKVSGKLATVIAMPAIREQIIQAGGEPGFLAGALFAQFMREDMARFGTAAKAANLTAE
jgi:tripartite-type tricarboxylate transporter receptor subunit TctC